MTATQPTQQSPALARVVAEPGEPFRCRVVLPDRLMTREAIDRQRNASLLTPVTGKTAHAPTVPPISLEDVQ